MNIIFILIFNMSSRIEPLNKNLIISYERQLMSKMNLDIDLTFQNNTEIFLSLLNNYSIANINHLYFLNKLLPNISNFNDICIKYFTILTESFKYSMNKNKSNKNNYEIVLVLNSISNFVKTFSANQEKYNEKHKSILKQFPPFLQLYFKLFQQKFKELLSNYSTQKKVIESYFILCLTFIEYYPTLMRNYQNIIENNIKNIFYNYISKIGTDIKTVNIAIVLYVNLYKLSPNIINRHQDYILIIINNIKYYMEYFRPKTIEEEENIKNNNNISNDKSILDDKNNLFLIQNENDKIIDNKNILHADKIMEILFKLLNNIFKYMANNIYFEIDFNTIFDLFNGILNLYESLDNNKSKSSLSMIIFNGLSKTNYELFLINTNEKIVDILIYLISNFSRYIYCYNIFFSKYINKILLNEKFFKNNIYTFNLHIKILSFFGTIISFYYHILPDEIELIIYKHIYNNLPILYLKYLQQNDKTLLKVDELYFKASSVKNKIYSYNKENIYNDDNLSPNDIHVLLYEYFKILLNYCSVAKNIFQLNYKNILGGIVDLIILPPYAKFIFNIDNDIKNIIIDIIEICIKRNLIYINKLKLFNFLKNFYLFDGNLKYKAEFIINLLQIKDSELLKESNYEDNGCYGGVPNNISGQIFDFNKKIKEYLSESYKKLQQINLNKNNNDNENKIEENKDENINKENINNELLNKKRKNKNKNDEKEKEKEDNSDDINESNSESEIYEKKGNKKKKIKDNIIIEKNNNEDDEEEKVFQNNENNNDIEKESISDKNDQNKNNIDKKEEDIQIDDIDIPDII